MENNLQVEYLSIDKIKPYERNAKQHPREQVEQIKQSIEEFGFNDPLALWHGEIVEGHGRYLAALDLGLEQVPVIRLDELTDEQRRAYALVHNKLTMNSDFDFNLLDLELDDISDIDMKQFGFEWEEDFDESDLDDEKKKENVIVSINCGDVRYYEMIKDRLQELTDEIQGSLSVKMA